MYKELKNLIKTQEKEKTYSKEEVFDMVKNVIKKNIEENTGQEISEQQLEKSFIRAFKNGVTLTALLNGAYYMGPQIESNKEQRQPASQIQQERQVKQNDVSQPKSFESKKDNQNSFREKKIRNFLRTISMNESSGGKNTNHRRMEGGIHAGDAAQGQYGLMPNTIKEMAVRMGKESPMYRYAKMDSKDIETAMKENPEHQSTIAEFMANKLHDKFGGDENKMAYSWFQGHNLTDDHFKDSHKDYSNHDYVQKYNKHRQMVEKTPVQNITNNSD